MALKVLTVDDSKTIRMIVKKAFKFYDCDLLEAENGIEGLAVTTREKPDLIILDITMPVMNGIEMLGKLKGESRLKDIPVIMLTAESGKDNVLQIVKMGVRDYIVKPFKGEELIERVEKFLTLEPKKKEKPVENSVKRFFSVNEDIQRLTMPEKIERAVAVEIEGHLQAKIKEMVSLGMDRFILDLGKVKEVSVSSIKMIISVIQKCETSKIRVRVVGSPLVGDQLREFQETSAITLDNSLEEAIAAL